MGLLALAADAARAAAGAAGAAAAEGIGAAEGFLGPAWAAGRRNRSRSRSSSVRAKTLLILLDQGCRVGQFLKSPPVVMLRPITFPFDKILRDPCSPLLDGPPVEKSLDIVGFLVVSIALSETRRCMGRSFSIERVCYGGIDKL